MFHDTNSAKLTTIIGSQEKHFWHPASNKNWKAIKQAKKHSELTELNQKKKKLDDTNSPREKTLTPVNFHIQYLK